MRSIFPWAALPLLVLSLGCGGGDDAPIKYEVSGQVTLDGQPLQQGRITFRPLDRATASASGKIENGGYVLECLSGQKRVEITSRRRIPGPKTTGSKASSGEPAITIEMLVPQQYNRESTLTAEVMESGGNRFVFALDSAPK